MTSAWKVCCETGIATVSRPCSVRVSLLEVAVLRCCGFRVPFKFSLRTCCCDRIALFGVVLQVTGPCVSTYLISLISTFSKRKRASSVFHFLGLFTNSEDIDIPSSSSSNGEIPHPKAPPQIVLAETRPHPLLDDPAPLHVHTPWRADLGLNDGA